MAPPEPMILSAIRFATANPTIRVAPASGVAETVTVVAAADTDYFLSGDGSASDLYFLVKTALDTMTGSQVFTVTPAAATNIYTISSDSGNFQLLWSHADSAVIGPILGVSTIPSDQTGASSYVGSKSSQGFWTPNRPFRRDTRNEPVAVGHLEETIDGQSRGYDFSVSRGERVIGWHLVDRGKILTEYAGIHFYLSLEYNWVNYYARGRTVRVYDDREIRTTSSYDAYRVRARQRPWKEMGVSFINRYEVELNLREV